jgi:hypothetical protein
MCCVCIYTEILDSFVTVIMEYYTSLKKNYTL